MTVKVFGIVYFDQSAGHAVWECARCGFVISDPSQNNIVEHLASHARPWPFPRPTPWSPEVRKEFLREARLRRRQRHKESLRKARAKWRKARLKR
jgi:Zn-finger protein